MYMCKVKMNYYNLTHGRATSGINTGLAAAQTWPATTVKTAWLVEEQLLNVSERQIIKPHKRESDNIIEFLK